MTLNTFDTKLRKINPHGVWFYCTYWQNCLQFQHLIKLLIRQPLS